MTAVARQIMWNRLISVVEEQAQALIRTAFSTSVREAGDLSAGVYDEQAACLPRQSPAHRPRQRHGRRCRPFHARDRRGNDGRG